MKYKVGDKVRIKSLDWYNQNKDISLIESTNSYYNFIEVMRGACGKVMTISSVNSNYYDMVEDAGEYFWTDEMIEGLAEETYDFLKTDKPNLPSLNDFMDMLNNEISLPEGYIFKDENGNVINAQKIVLEKKKNEYPKTYKECCEVLNWNHRDYDRVGYESELLCKFQVLLLCRDAYWKIAGEEMGLGKPWKPDWKDNYQKKWTINFYQDWINLTNGPNVHFFLAFPTEEIRNAFYENFKELIENCKELL